MATPSQSPYQNPALYALRDNELYKTIYGRINHHIGICERQIDKYSRWALRTRYTLPLLTAVATFIASGLAGLKIQGKVATSVAVTLAAVSFCAAIVSALNSAIRPAIQYGHYVRSINRFWKQRVLLEFDIQQVLISTQGQDAQSRDKQLIETLRVRNLEVERTIAGFSEESANNIGLPISKGMHMPMEKG
jgi:hypothetical protein